MIQEEQGKEPVLIITNQSGKLVHVGHPDTFKKKLLGEYAQEGHKIETTTIEKFRAKKYKWHWEK